MTELFKVGKMSKAAENLYVSQPALSLCVQRIEQQLLDISNERSYLGYSDLYHVFGQMNVINRAVSVADKVEVPEKRFYFERDGGLFLHHLTNDYLKVGSKDKKNNSQVVISFLWIKKWFGDKVKKEEILGILNNAIL